MGAHRMVTVTQAEAAKWGAKKGEQITGKLYRGGSGQFTGGSNGDEGKGDEGKSESLTGLGLTQALRSALALLQQGKPVDQRTRQRLQNMGLTTETGGLSQLGRSLAKAIKNKDNPEAIRLLKLAKEKVAAKKDKAKAKAKGKGKAKAKAKAKPKAKGGGGGGGGDKAEEDIAAQAESLTKHLLAISDGEDIPEDALKQLIKLKLVEEQDGEYVLSPSGVELMSGEQDDIAAAIAKLFGEADVEPGGPDKCVCPDCDYEVDKKRGTPCRSMVCPECGATLVAGGEAVKKATAEEIARQAIETARALVNDSQVLSAFAESNDITPKHVANRMLDDLERELGEAVWSTKFVNDLPDSSFALVLPGGEKDEDGKTAPRSLRKLPYKDANGKVDLPHLRNALARISQMKGATAAQRASAQKKLDAAAKKHLKTRQEEADLTEAEINTDELRSLLEQALTLLKMPEDESEEEPEEEEPAAEASITESMTEMTLAGEATSEDIAALKEDGVTVGTGRRAPVLVDFQVMKPGPGNKRDGHYYPPAVVKRDIGVFEGADIFVTDHKAGERGEKTKVGRLRRCPTGFIGEGAPVGQAIIYDPDQAEKTRNRADAGELKTLECSIYGIGRAKPGEIDGVNYKIVEAITEGKYLELVSKAGAGGHAIGLAENDGGEDMSDEKGVAQETQAEETPEGEQVEEVNLAEGDKPEDKVEKLAEADITTALSEVRLPESVKSLLKLREYADADELKAAVAEMVETFKEVTGSGKPTVKKGAASVPTAKRSLAEVEVAQSAINQKWLGGIRRVKEEASD